MGLGSVMVAYSTALTLLNTAPALRSVLCDFCNEYSELGDESKRRNAFTQGSFVMEDGVAEEMDEQGLRVRVQVRERKWFGGDSVSERVALCSWLPDDAADLSDSDGVRRALTSFARGIGGAKADAACVALLQGLGGSGATASRLVLPDNLRLNNVPHSPLAREWLYRSASTAVLEALADGGGPRRLQLTALIPETNPSMDTFRVGTMLELVRELCLDVVGSGGRVCVAVQGSMGEGAFTAMPLALSGVRALLEMMDWGAEDAVVEAKKEEEKEEEEGGGGSGDAEGAKPSLSISPGDGGRRRRRDGAGEGGEKPAPAKPKVKPFKPRKKNVMPTASRLGGRVQLATLGADAAALDVDLHIVIAPQNIVGGNVLEPLGALTAAAEQRGQRVLLINPKLEDRPSPNDVMQVRGRAERQAFARSFSENEIFNARLLYTSGVSYFPIKGALLRAGAKEDYVLFERYDTTDDAARAKAGVASNVNEAYVPFTTFERRPSNDEISTAFDRKAE